MTEKRKDSKGLFCEKECHSFMARICGKSRTERNLKTFISESTKTFRDAFVLTAALGAISENSGASLVPLPSDPNKIIRTINENDIKTEHDNILKAIAYWHKGKNEKNQDCHKILIEVNEFRKIGELFCFLGKEYLQEIVTSGMFNSELIKKLIYKKK